MKKREKRTTYMGGEWDSPAKVTPKMFENFLRKKFIYGVLGILVFFTVLVMLLEALL